MKIELHLLQNFAPSNLNRDDTGSPKDCEFGGHRRARISSQCIKRAIRNAFKTLLPADDLAVRTKRLLKETVDRLVAHGKTESEAEKAVRAALAGGGLKVGDDNLTQYLLFLGQGEIKALVELVVKHFDELKGVNLDAKEEGEAKKKTAKQEKSKAKDAVPPEVSKAVKAILDGGKAVDLALFGRMLADLPEHNVDAACQVAHALSTNKIHSMELDYYTAVDDLKPGDTSGADMIGTVEFNSACYYRYSTLDLGQLLKTLGGDKELSRKGVEAFLKASITAIPTGKQNSFAAQNLPSLIFANAHEGPAVSLANAFLKPATPTGEHDLVSKSVQMMDQHAGSLAKLYGQPATASGHYCALNEPGAKNLGSHHDSVDAFVKAVLKQAGL
jgi:CRISPR system Cascade subunit CasC